MVWLSEFLHLPYRLTLIMFGGGLNRNMLPWLIMCLDNMCASLFFWGGGDFMLDKSQPNWGYLVLSLFNIVVSLTCHLEPPTPIQPLVYLLAPSIL